MVESNFDFSLAGGQCQRKSSKIEMKVNLTFKDVRVCQYSVEGNDAFLLRIRMVVQY